MDDKQEKIALTKLKLTNMLKFLQNYLPLANVHSNNFILHNIWDTYLSSPIRSNIEDMSDDDIIGLQQRMLHYQEKEIVNVDTVSVTTCGSTLLSSDYLKDATKTGNQSILHELPVYPVEWKHESIDEFARDAARNSLPCSGLVWSLEKLKDTLKGSEELLIMSTFMTSKKSHEVGVMSDVCHHLAKDSDVDVIVDIGSGKGYLSTQLVYQHNACVVAVDSQTSNTHGAQKRVTLLDRQWGAIVRQSEDVRLDGMVRKKGKKAKKMLKQPEKHNNTVLDSHLNISEETLEGMQALLSNVQVDVEEVAVTDTSVDLNCDHLNSSGSDATNNAMVKSNHETVEECIKTPGKTLTCSICGKCFSINEVPDKKIQNDLSITGDKLICAKCRKSLSAKHQQLYYPVTMYVHDNINIMETVEQTGACSGEATLMLTGLHTCGALGTSIQRLFVNNPTAKVLCYVGCCYHLMNEEFVASPFPDGDSGIGFPMSSLLREHRVGLGRHARNFASQTLHQPITELKAKSFPRCLLQKILYDTFGYVDVNWKGLRKLDQKCSDMFQYVIKAVDKLKLSTDKITPEVVADYTKRYRDEERRLAMFLQIKSLLAPCIEAIVILDRYLYLLEQECIKDAILVRMFDPVTSPRCHAIVAYKQ